MWIFAGFIRGFAGFDRNLLLLNSELRISNPGVDPGVKLLIIEITQ